MKFGIDWSQPSTLRGLVWGVFSSIAVLCVVFGKPEAAGPIMAIGGGCAAGLGIVVKD